MKKLFLSVFGFILLLGNAVLAADAPDPEHYYIPPAQLNAQFEIMDLGFANIFALFRNGTGSFEFEETGKTLSNLRLALDTRSLVASNANNEGDLASLFGIRQFPEIDFVARDNVTFTDNKAEIKGNLMLHGVTKPFTMQAVINHIGKSPHGGGMWSSKGAAVGLSLSGSFKRADFGMVDDPNAESRFGDTITLRLEMQAIRQ